MTEQERQERKRREEDYYLERNSRLAANDDEAEQRYQKYMGEDPYPNIDAALLNSADVFKYVEKTGMLYPFDVKKLKGASYDVSLKGKVIWWDEEKKMRQEKDLTEPGDDFELKPNSIAFLTLEPMFRIPDYIAMRFNLRIVHVYKGLLLGTGPLVDPGFVGRLSIPLHNLTANTYVFRTGDDLIQMEFTKLSRNSEWQRNKNLDEGLYIRNWITPKRELKEYLSRALQGGSDSVVKSSIPNEMQKILGKTEDAKKEMKRFKKDNRIAQIINILALLGIVTLAVTTIVQLGNAYSDNREQVQDLQKQVEEYENKVDSLNIKIDGLEDKVIQDDH